MARNPERGGGIVSSVLISLAAAAGITAIGLGAGVGAGMVIHGPLDAPVDQSVPAQVYQEQDDQAPKKGSYIGPTLMIENGEVVWRSGQDQSTPEPAENPMNPPEDAAPVQGDPVNAGTPVQPDAAPTPAPQPESPAASAGQSTGSAEKPATKTPSSSAGTSSGSKVTAAPNQTQSSGTQSVGNTGSRDFSGGKVLATTASNNNNDPVYHTKNCRSAQKIDANDEKWYNSAADAEAGGRRLCKICGK